VSMGGRHKGYLQTDRFLALQRSADDEAISFSNRDGFTLSAMTCSFRSQTCPKEIVQQAEPGTQRTLY